MSFAEDTWSNDDDQVHETKEKDFLIHQAPFFSLLKFVNSKFLFLTAFIITISQY